MLPLDVRKKILGMMAAGHSDRAIMRECGCTYNVPFYYRKKGYRSVEEMRDFRGSGNNRSSPETANLIRSLYRQGHSQRSIARLANVGINTVRNHTRPIRDEVPLCRHGVRLHKCAACFSAVRIIGPDGKIEFRHGGTVVPS